MPAQQTADDRVALGAGTVAFLMIGQQVLGRATRDAFYLQQFSATDLPLVMTITSVLGVGVVLLASRLLVTFGPRRVAPWLFFVHGLFFMAEWWLSDFAPGVAAFTTYVHTGAFGGASISAFWSLLNERFDPHTAKRVFGRIGAGATAGGVAGGLGTWGVSQVAPVSAMLLVAAGIALSCGLGALLLGRTNPLVDVAAKGGSAKRAGGALQVMRETPFLQKLLAIVALVSFADVLVDYLFKAGAASRHIDGPALLAFFSAFYTVTGVATFVVQAALAQRLLTKIGLAATATTLPGAALLGAVASYFVPGFMSAMLLRAGTSVAENSVYRSAYELAYTPLAAEKKRPTKTLIDVGGGKVGAAVAGGVAVIIVTVVPASLVASVMAATIVVVAIGTLLLIRPLHRGYVSTLADGLRSGALELTEDAMAEKTTRATYADTVTLDRDKLLAEIARHHGADPPPAEAPEPAFRAPTDPLLGARAALMSRNPARVEEALSQFSELPDRLVPQVVSLLDREETVELASRALKSVAERNLSALTEVLDDGDLAVSVRARLPRIIRAVGTVESLDALVRGLDSPEFSIRFACASSLLRRLQQQPDLTFDEALILSHARKELGRDVREWTYSAVMPSTSGNDDVFVVDHKKSRELSRGLTYLFTLFSLVYEQEPLRLAFAALASENKQLRGTGLEYLEHILPPDVHRRLLPLFDDRAAAKTSLRTRNVLLKELEDSKDSLVLPAELLARSPSEPPVS